LTRLDPRRPDAGDLAYSYCLLTSLAGAGAALTVLTFTRVRDAAASPVADGVEWVLIANDAPTGGWRAIRSLVSRLPNCANTYNTKNFQRALGTQLARDWDVVVIDHLGMGWVWPRVAAHCNRNFRAVSVFVAHNCDADIRRAMAQNYQGNALLKQGLRIDASRAARLERELVRGAALVSVITAEDRTRFRNPAKSVLIPPGHDGRLVRFREISTSTPRRAVMFGNLSWFAKQMNLKELLAAADELFARHQIELWVVGKVPDKLRAAGHLRATRFLGFVEDPEPIFGAARIGIIAERTGGGFKLKSLDFVFHRLPIAATYGSLSGLPLTPDIDYLSFASVSELAQGVVASIDDLDRLNALQNAAYEKCRAARNWAWDERGKTLLRAMQDALDNRASTGPGGLTAQRVGLCPDSMRTSASERAPSSLGKPDTRFPVR
jgi:hypothetical protein